MAALVGFAAMALLLQSAGAGTMLRLPLTEAPRQLELPGRVGGKVRRLRCPMTLRSGVKVQHSK